MNDIDAYNSPPRTDDAHSGPPAASAVSRSNAGWPPRAAGSRLGIETGSSAARSRGHGSRRQVRGWPDVAHAAAPVASVVLVVDDKLLRLREFVEPGS